MEGFDKEALDEILGLEAQGLHSVVMLALGYRDEKTDYLVNAAKVRKPINELVTLI
jgi:nitroreductase